MSVVQLYNAIEAQEFIMRLGNNFKYVEKNPRSKMYKIHLELKDGEPEPDLEEIVSITTFTYQGDYVYDLSTENEHFQSGVGVNIVHNTDSVMVKFPEEWEEKEAFQKSEKLAKEITEVLFRPPSVLEFEKIYSYYLLLTKKRYAGMKKEYFEDTPVMDIKGLEPVRRENSLYVTDFLNLTLDLMLRQGKPTAIYHELATYLETTLKGDIAKEKFIMTTQLQAEKNYKQLTAPRILGTRLNTYFGYDRFTVGDRIPYIHIVPPHVIKKVQGQTRLDGSVFFGSTRNLPTEVEKIEHLELIEKFGYQIDYEYYIMALSKKLDNMVQFLPIRDKVYALFASTLSRFLDVKGKGVRKRVVNEKAAKKEEVVKKKPMTIDEFFKKK